MTAGHIRLAPVRPSRRTLVAALASFCWLALPGAAAADLYVTTGGSDANACTQAAPCRSFNRAYGVAAPGSTVQVGAGSYGEQTIASSAAKTSASDVVFTPAAGASVTLGGLSVNGSHVTVQGMSTGSVAVERGSGGQLVTDVTVKGGKGTNLFVGGGASAVNILGGSYGGTTDYSPAKVQGSPAPSYVLLDGVTIHDAVRTDPVAHLECLYAADVQYLTVRNSRFQNCAIFDIFMTNLSGVDPKNVTIENNFFDSAGSHGGSLSTGYYSLYISPNIGLAANYVIRQNSFAQAPSFEAGYHSNIVVANNAGYLSACPEVAGIAFDHNVWGGARCGSTDKQAAPGFVNVDAYDLHLTAGSAAINAGGTAYATTTDIDGQARPAGGAPDAGADEYGATGGAPAPPPPPPDTTPPQTTLTSGPSGSMTSRTASFSFTSSESGSTFACKLGTGAWAGCTSPWALSSLATGTYTVQVRATDKAGNTDLSPATRTWTITATAPPPPAPAPPASGSSFLLGYPTVARQRDTNFAGKAEAFVFLATATGKLAAINLFVASDSTGSGLTLGLYDDRSGHPRRLLGSGALAAPAANAWNRVPVSAVNVTAGTRYWIALLATKGDLRFRDEPSAGASETSLNTALKALPTTWTTGRTYTDGALSAWGSR